MTRHLLTYTDSANKKPVNFFFCCYSILKPPTAGRCKMLKPLYFVLTREPNLLHIFSNSTKDFWEFFLKWVMSSLSPKHENVKRDTCESVILNLTFLGAIAMSFNGSTVGSGSGTTRTSLEFGRTHVVRPKGKHEATVVWLHGLGDKGSSWSQLLESLPLPNVKWICPTAPTRPVAAFGGFPCTAWFDVGDISEDAPDDLECLDFSAAHVANLLSTEPADVKLCVGGFSMGAATALYSATCHAFRQYGNGSLYQVNLSAVVGLSGWLPCSRTLRHRMQGMNDAGRRAASLPILLCHGTGDDVVAYQHGEKSARVLSSSGFQNLTMRTYEGLGHYTIPEETDEICHWLSANLRLGGT